MCNNASEVKTEYYHSIYRWPRTARRLAIGRCGGEQGSCLRRYGTGIWIFSSYQWLLRPELKRKCCRFDDDFVTGCTKSCENDDFRCNQWRKFHYNDDISVSMFECQTVTRLRSANGESKYIVYTCMTTYSIRNSIIYCQNMYRFYDCPHIQDVHIYSTHFYA